MVSKGFMELLAEAQAAVEQISVEQARSLAETDEAVFVDVREQHEWVKGHIPGAVHAPRGFLEFIADPRGPMHNPALASGQPLVVYCGSGGRSALAAKTLHDMGLTQAVNMTGGFQAWAQSGGAIAD